MVLELLFAHKQDPWCQLSITWEEAMLSRPSVYLYVWYQYFLSQHEPPWIWPRTQHDPMQDYPLENNRGNRSPSLVRIFPIKTEDFESLG